MPDFELRFVAVPEIKQDADKDLRKQWEQRFQKLVVGRVEVNAEIPQQTLTKLRNQYAQITNQMGQSTAAVGRDIEALAEKYGKAFDMTGVASKFNIDITKATQEHLAQVRGLESEYVNLKTKMRDASQTLVGTAAEKEIDRLEKDIQKLGIEIKKTFSPDELEHFNRTMGQLGGKGAGQVVGIQEYADSISGLRTRIVELAGEGERLVRVTQQWDGKQWINVSTQIQDRTQKLTSEYKKLNSQVKTFDARYKLSTNASSYMQEWRSFVQQLENFNADAPDARAKLDNLSQSFAEFKGKISRARDDLSLYRDQLKDVREAEVALKTAQLEKAGVRDDEIIGLEQLRDAKRDEAEETRRSLMETDKATAANALYVKSEDQLEKQLRDTEKEWKKKNSLLGNIVAGYQDAIARVVNYTSVYRVMWLAVSKFKESIRIAQDLNKSFTSIEMVTLGTAEATEKLRKEYADLAVEMSGTVTQVASAADEWLRQGKTAQETTELIRASMVMSRIGAIESAEATTYLTSVLNGYKIETQDVMHVVDAMSQVDIESASSVDDLAIALQRSASTANMAGVSFERLLGYVATVREVTQRSASVVGESELYALEAA